MCDAAVVQLYLHLYSKYRRKYCVETFILAAILSFAMESTVPKERRATRDRNATTYESHYKALNLIKTNSIVHTILMNTITEARGNGGICMASQDTLQWHCQQWNQYTQ